MTLKDDIGEILYRFADLFECKMQDGAICTFELLFPERNGSPPGQRTICARLFRGSFTGRDGKRVAIEEGRAAPLCYFEESAIVAILRAQSKQKETAAAAAPPRPPKSAERQKGLFE